jgi:hypothetical protein
MSRNLPMDPERWKRVDELLHSALQVPTGQQEEFLRHACSVKISFTLSRTCWLRKGPQIRHRALHVGVTKPLLNCTKVDAGPE